MKERARRLEIHFERKEQFRKEKNAELAVLAAEHEIRRQKKSKSMGRVFQRSITFTTSEIETYSRTSEDYGDE